MEFSSHSGALWLNSQRFFLKGCSWFGCETDTKCVHGIWSLKLETFLDFLVEHRFNSVRLPFTAELALDLDGPDNLPTAINFWENKALEGKTAGQVLDYLIAQAAKRGILIMLDMHCLTCSAGITDLWYTDSFSEEKLLVAWRTIVTRYLGAWNVFAVDLKNEPHGSATWGDGNHKTDWRIAAQLLGKAILAINPRLLVFVEGTSGTQTPITTPEGAFWGGSLASARESPVVFSRPGRLVYSPHVYGPGVYMQEYFKAANFPHNMPDIWTRQWGHLMLEPRAGPAVVVGEWGGFFKSGTLERTWAEAFVGYLSSIGATGTFFWGLNPNSGDTGGLLLDDWTTPDAYKLDLLHRLCPHATKIEVGADGQPVNATSSSHVASLPQATIRTPAPSPSSHALPQPEREDRTGSAYTAIEVENAKFPAVQLSAKIINEWDEGERGRRYQLEGRFRNLTTQTIPNVGLDIFPGECVAQFWNLTAILPGRLYALPDFCVNQGGLKPQEELPFGGIFSTADLNLSLRSFE